MSAPDRKWEVRVPKVVITMPAYRSAGTLAKTLADIPEGVAHEVVLVDDASPDDTVRVARELGIRVHTHPVNLGYGGNQKTCYRLALATDADVVVLLHPDYQYDPKAIPLLLAPILAGDADMTFGSRFAGLGDPMRGGMPAYRFVGNRVSTVLENLMLGGRFTDLHSGMRAYTRRCLLSLPFLRYDQGFLFDSQVLADAITSGLRVVEVPIPTRYTTESSSISVVRSFGYVARTLGYSATRSLQRGRRGRRWSVTRRGLRRGPLLPAGRPVRRPCILCGGDDQALIYPATARGPLEASEFACTTDALGAHDDIVQCRTCGLVSAAADHDDLIDGYEGAVDESYLDEEEGRRGLFRWVSESVGAYALRGNHLLEIGSHVGVFLDVARERGWTARGVEPSKWAVELGTSRFGVDLRQGTVEDLDDPPGSADAVVMLDVLEHLQDPLAALRRLREVVDDEGALALSTVNLSGLHGRLRGASWPWFIRSHLYYFTPETLGALLRRAGFRMVEWTPVPRWMRLSYLARRGRATLGPLGPVVEQAAKVADVPVPLGWLGDIALVVARPD